MRRHRHCSLRRALPLTVSLALLLCGPALAQQRAPAEPGVLSLSPPATGPFVGDAWLYPHHNLLVRWAADLVAIPTSVVTWDHGDLATFTAWSAGVVSLMVGPVPGDVTVQTWAHQTFGRPGTRLTVWGPWTDVAVWGSLGLTGVALLVRGWMADQPELVELVSLTIEAFSVAQIFHVVPKLLLGREGPMDADGHAVIFGPSASLRLYPAGTPSGHAASFYAVLGVLSMSTENPWLLAALHAVGVAFCATMLVDDYHFLSDLLWGAAMGYSVGQWVVRHRSTRFRDDGPHRPVRTLPVVDVRTGAAALAIAFSL